MKERLSKDGKKVDQKSNKHSFTVVLREKKKRQRMKMKRETQRKEVTEK